MTNKKTKADTKYVQRTTRSLHIDPENLKEEMVCDQMLELFGAAKTGTLSMDLLHDKLENLLKECRLR